MDSDEKIAFSRAMLKIVDGVMSGEMTEEYAAKRLENGAEWLRTRFRLDGSPETPKQKSERLKPSMDEVRAVFDHWKITTHRPRAVLDQSRVVRIRQSLKHFSVAQLQHIASWAINDDFFSGVNERGERYDTIESLYTNVPRIEKNLERSGWGDNRVNFERRSLEEESALALKEGRVDEYNQLQLEIEGIDETNN